jgi:hypothetical protein
MGGAGGFLKRACRAGCREGGGGFGRFHFFFKNKFKKGIPDRGPGQTMMVRNRARLCWDGPRPSTGELSPAGRRPDTGPSRLAGTVLDPAEGLRLRGKRANLRGNPGRWGKKLQPAAA